MNRTVTVVRTGTANVASVVAALRRLGCEVETTADLEDVVDAEWLVLPGVGALGAAMETLVERGIDGPLRERIFADRPTLTVCLGLQLLLAGSDESPGVPGLGCVPARATRFVPSSDLRVPHLGWSKVLPQPGARYLPAGYAYFAHSYKLDTLPPGWQGAYAEHGSRFVAAMERGHVLACQFHPELSGKFGEDILRRWLKGA